MLTKQKNNPSYTVGTLLQAHPPGWAFECLGPGVPLEFEPTRGGLIIQCGRYCITCARLIIIAIYCK